MGRIVRKTFYSTTRFTVPAGITRLRITGENTHRSKITVFSQMGRIIDKDGALWAYGSNVAGELGTGNTTDNGSTPQLVVGGKKFTRVYTSLADSVFGGAYNYAIDENGDGYGWGSNNSISPGTLGVGTVTTAYSSPVMIAGGKKWTQIYPLTGGRTYGIDTQGQLWAWGLNGGTLPFPPFSVLPSQLGLGSDGDAVKSTPALVVGGKKWKMMNGDSLGQTYGVDQDGNGWAWGNNSIVISVDPDTFLSTVTGGALGTGSSNPAVFASTPMLISGGIKWKKILGAQTMGDLLLGLGNPLAAGLSEDGKVYMWGGNIPDTDVVGLPHGNPAYSVPTLIEGQSNLKFSDFGVLTNGALSTFYGLTASGDLYLWGADSGSLLPGGVLVSSPTLLTGGLKFSKIFPRVFSPNFGGSGLVGLSLDGQMYSWGNNDRNSAGTGSPDYVSTPTLIQGGRRYVDVVIEVEADKGLAVDSDGNCWEWGAKFTGATGSTTASSPIAVAGSHIVDVRNSPQEVIVLDVTPGSIVPIEMSGQYASVNGTPFARLPRTIVVEYEN